MPKTASSFIKSGEGDAVNLSELKGLLYEVGVSVQNVFLLGCQGKQKKSLEAMKKVNVLKEKCAYNNIAINFCEEILFPLQDGKFMHWMPPPFAKWIPPQVPNELTADVRITLVFKLIFTGHADMASEGFRAEVLNNYKGGDEKHAAGEKELDKSEGGLTSLEETHKFLKDLGLGDLFDK